MTGKLTKYLKFIEPWHRLVTLLILVVGGIWGANAWVKKTAHDAVLEETFLTTLAARVRPVCIFDSNGAIEADLGAMEYIEDIHVIPAPQIYGFEVVVKAKRHLAYAPLITGLDLDLHPQAATRGKLHTCNIMLSPASTTESITTGEPMNTTKLHRFRLEILH
jgi:hypothetical protein